MGIRNRPVATDVEPQRLAALDPTLGDPTTASAVEAAIAVDPGRFDGIVRSIGDPDLRVHVVRTALGAVADRQPDWIAPARRESVASMLHGFALLEHAAMLQAGAPGNGSETWSRVHQHLRQAERELTWVVRTDPHRVDAFTGLFSARPALAANPVETADLWRRCLAVNGMVASAAIARCDGLAPRFGGSVEAMFAFADEAEAHAPNGSPVHATVASAVLEWAIASLDAGASPTNETVVGRLRSATQRCGFEQRRATSPIDLDALNACAVAAVAVGDQELATWLVSLIGADPHRIVGPRWARLGDPIEVFLSVSR